MDNALIYSQRISSICQGSIAGGDPLNANVEAQCIVWPFLMDRCVARDDTQRWFFLLYVENGIKRYRLLRRTFILCIANLTAINTD